MNAKMTSNFRNGTQMSLWVPRYWNSTVNRLGPPKK